MALDDIINVTITVTDASVSQLGFGTPALLGRTAVLGADLARSYSSLDGFLADFSPAGVTAAIDVENVRAATAIFSQQPSVDGIVFLRQTSTPNALAHTITPVAQDDTDYIVTINGVDFTHPSGTGATVSSITAGLETLINAGSEPVTATDNTTDVSLAADVAGDTYSLKVSNPNLLQIATTSADEGVVADLTAARAENDAWYTLHLVRHVPAEILAMAAHVETLRRLFITSSHEYDDLADNSGTPETLNSNAYNRTAIGWAQDSGDHFGASWAGKVLPFNPGSVNWNYQQLSGVLPFSFSSSEETNLSQYNATIYTTFKGRNVTVGGKAASGRYLDITRTVDELYDLIQTNVFNLLVNESAAGRKVPYTNKGGAQIESAVRAALGTQFSNGAIVADFTTSVPDVATISSAVKATRVFPDVQFSATLTGAVDSVTITGTVSP